MGEELICLDSTVLIEYFRKVDKTHSFLYKLTPHHPHFAVSILTQYEIYIGSNLEQDLFWNQFFQNIEVLPFENQACIEAIKIFQELKAQNKLIDTADLLIGATALSLGLKLATLNEKHFKRIEGLSLITP